MLCAAVSCGAPAPPLHPAGSEEDDGVGVLARWSSKIVFDGVGDDEGGSYDEPGDRYLRRDDDTDPLAYAGYGYGGFGYGGFGYGGDGYGGMVGLGIGYGYAPAVPPPTYEAVGIGDLGTIDGALTWAGSAGVAWPADCRLARVASRGAPVVGAVAYLDKLERGRAALVPTTPVVTAQPCGLVPTVQLVSPLPAVATIESHRTAAVLLTATTVTDEQLALDPGGRVELALDRPGPMRLAAPGLAPAWLWALPHPYYAVTDARGRFRLDQVPPGNYTLVIWSPPLVTAVGPDGPTWSPAVTERHAVTVRPSATATVSYAVATP